MKSKPLAMTVHRIIHDDTEYPMKDGTKLFATIHSDSYFTGVLVNGDDENIIAHISGRTSLPKKPNGRKPTTAKHMAVRLCFMWLKAKGKTDKCAYQEIMKRFRYRDDREIRRLCKQHDPKNDWRGDNLVFSGKDNGDGALSMIFYNHDAWKYSEEALTIDGEGWIWKPWDSEATYGHWRGGGKLNR